MDSQRDNAFGSVAEDDHESLSNHSCRCFCDVCPGCFRVRAGARIRNYRKSPQKLHRNSGSASRKTAGSRNRSSRTAPVVAPNRSRNPWLAQSEIQPPQPGARSYKSFTCRCVAASGARDFSCPGAEL